MLSDFLLRREWA